MKKLSDQVADYMAFRQRMEPEKPFGAQELADLVKEHQPPGENPCVRQDIDNIAIRNIKRPRYFVSLAKAMGTTPEALAAGTFVPGAAPAEPPPVKGEHFQALDDAEWMMLQHYRGMLDEDREELSAEIERRAEHVRKVVQEKTKGLSVPVVSRAPSPANKPKRLKEPTK